MLARMRRACTGQCIVVRPMDIVTRQPRQPSLLGAGSRAAGDLHPGARLIDICMLCSVNWRDTGHSQRKLAPRRPSFTYAALKSAKNSASSAA